MLLMLGFVFEVTEIQLKLSLFIKYLWSAYSVPVHFVGWYGRSNREQNRQTALCEASVLVIKNKQTNKY